MERLAEMSHNAFRKGRPHPFDFRREITFQRGNAGGPERFVILDSELLAIPWVLFKIAGKTKRGPYFYPRQRADDCYPAAHLALSGCLDQSDQVAARIVDKENLLERAFEFLLRWSNLIHGRDGMAAGALRSLCGPLLAEPLHRPRSALSERYFWRDPE